MKKYFEIYAMPIGKVVIAEQNGFITDLFPITKAKETIKAFNEETNLLKEAASQLRRYFEGSLCNFDLPLNPIGTEFQKDVWKALCDIPYGETRSYKEIAIAINNEKAVRAVGLANNRNPISFVIPCHRVIGSDGSLVGYGGGLPLKVHLLRLEKNVKLKQI